MCYRILPSACFPEVVPYNIQVGTKLGGIMADRDGWVSDEDLNAAKNMEHMVYGTDAVTGKKTRQLSAAFARTQAAKVFQENAASAALTIARIAQHGSNENIRLKAATYITDRVMGRIPDANAAAGEDSPLEKMLQDLHSDLEVNKAASAPTPYPISGPEDAATPEDLGD